MQPKTGAAEPALAAGSVCHGWVQAGKGGGKTAGMPEGGRISLIVIPNSRYPGSELGATAAAQPGVDSEQFRSVPKPRRALCGTLSCRKRSARAVVGVLTRWFDTMR